MVNKDNETIINGIKLTDNLNDIFVKYPYIMQAYVKKGMLCVGCKVSKFETIAESFVHNKVEDKDDFLTYLNEVKDKEF